MTTTILKIPLSNFDSTNPKGTFSFVPDHVITSPFPSCYLLELLDCIRNHESKQVSSKGRSLILTKRNESTIKHYQRTRYNLPEIPFHEQLS